ncbi:MAG: HEAT repeat domain-containing protein [Methyloligellaceae bacterium]
MLSDGEAPIRDQAITSLFETGETRCREFLEPLLEDPDKYVRKNAKWVLENIG